jgi:hypothetical protein
MCHSHYGPVNHGNTRKLDFTINSLLGLSLSHRDYTVAVTLGDVNAR